MPSLLGKRGREAAEGTVTILTRSKKRRVANVANDENRNPFITDDCEFQGEHGEQVDVGELLVSAKEGRVKPRTVTSKHEVPARCIHVSPSKIDSHFKVGKCAIAVYHDGKSDSQPCPQTPRHRDALSKKVPVTPRHRALASQLTPRTPKAPATPANAGTSVYTPARQLFSRCANPGKLIGRDSERQELSGFMEKCLESKSAGCMYVSGPPGTGKSALVGEVIEKYRDAENITLSVVNCMSVRNARDLSQKLSEDLELKEDTRFEYLKACFLQGKATDSRKHLVILDEVDRLVDLDLDLLYCLFEWSMQPKSRLILLGIANALDLTDRFLPRLKSRNLKPELLPFMPYTASEIADVLTAKLQTLLPSDAQPLPFLHPAAIHFCAKKVAAQTGDLRKAFDICRRAIDVVEQETKGKHASHASRDSPSRMPLMETINLSSPPTPRSPDKQSPKATLSVTYTLETAPKATIAHMAKVTAQVFGNGTMQRLNSLNLQQKAVLCALAALEKRKRETQVERTMYSTPSKTNNSAPSVRQLYEAYSTLCKREKLLHPLASVEFRDVVSGLETLSLVSTVDGRNGSLMLPITPSRTPSRRGKGGLGLAAMGDERRVASAVGYKELSAALEGAGGELLREILEGDVLL